MKRLILSMAMLLLLSRIAFSQEGKFMAHGSITYEKTVNLYGLLKQYIGKNPSNIMLTAVDKYKETHPQFRRFTGTLVFGSNKTLYTPEAAENDKVLDYNDPAATPGNTCFADFDKNALTVQRNVHDEFFSVKDTLKNINWRYTSETRMIAGYNCRRANAIVLDSVYVVAFYTEEIHVPGGPESFHGLPGMILGIALPYENVTWFATKVTDAIADPAAITPPAKGKAVNEMQFRDFLFQKMKTWGNTGRYEQKVFSL